MLATGRDAMWEPLPGRVSYVSVVLTRDRESGEYPTVAGYARPMATDPSVHITSGDPAGTAEPARASLGRRLAALFVDWIGCLLIAGAVFGSSRTVPEGPPLVLILEYTFFVGFFTQTPGMWLARIRCVSVRPGREGRPLGAPRAALRGLLLALAVPALLMDHDQRGLHDKAAGSQMLRVPTAG
jgi:uncharacterized RDD family membrane protein YckC